MDLFHLSSDEIAFIGAKTLEHLRIFAMGLQGQQDNTAIESFIFASLLISDECPSEDWVDRAYTRTKTWIDNTPGYDPNRRHRLRILSYIISVEIEQIGRAHV